MKKNLALALAALVTASALALAGCSQVGAVFHDPVQDANRAIQDANAQLKSAADSEAKVQKLAVDMAALPPTPDGAKQALDVVAQMRAELDPQRAALEAAKKSLSGIASLDVKPELKKYAELELKSIGTRLLVLKESAALYDQLVLMYTAVRDGTLTAKLSKQISVDRDTAANNVAALTDQAVEESKAASDYFDLQDLGGTGK